MVEDKTINIILDALNARDLDWLKTQFQEINPAFDITTMTGAEILGEAMFQLNFEAIKERYGAESTIEEWRNPKYGYIFSGSANKFQALKSLECWLYQCSEGKVCNTELYKLFDTTVRVAFMKKIIEQVEGYNQTIWG